MKLIVAQAPPEALFLSDLERRGLTRAQADAAGIGFTANARRDVGAAFKPLAAIRLPYLDVHGQPILTEIGGERRAFERVRYLEDTPPGFIAEKPRRYQQPTHTRPFAYFPRCDAVNWQEVLADPTRPIIMTEGEFKALIASLAGFQAIGLGGVFNFMHAGALLPELEAFASAGRHVYIVHDADPSPKTRRNVALAERRLAAELIRRGAIPHIVRLPVPDDGGKIALDDFLTSPDGGAEKLRALLEATPPADANATLIQAGTDVELADAVIRDMEDKYGSALIYSEGAFYAFRETHWRALPEPELANAIYRFDRAPYGQSGTVRITDGRAKSILAIMRNRAADERFFADAPAGINCANGFISIDASGAPHLEPHDRDQRQRHCLPGSWSPETDWRSAPLLGAFLRGCFAKESDYEARVALIGELLGVAALGTAAHLKDKKAAILYGPKAKNGKSEFLAMVRGLLPKEAVCSVPLTKFSDPFALIQLAGRRLNAVPELGAAQAVASEAFKAVVSGDQIMARDLHKPNVFFSPTALHICATNHLPPFQGGFDNGVQRRLLVLPFNRAIPDDEQIADIGSRIASEEADALLALAVEGACRVQRSGAFTEPLSSRAVLHEWVFNADPVLAWVHNRTEPAPGQRVPTKNAYADFRLWAEQEGFRTDRIPAINNFVQRILNANALITNGKNNGERYLVGLKLVAMGAAGRTI